MMESLAADLVMLIHFGFIVFVVTGGFAALKWRWLAWLHMPALVWVAWLEFTGAICPLTPLENHLRQLAGEAGYSGGFIAHYITPLIYPQGLTREIQVILGAFLVTLNLIIYSAMIRRHHGHFK